MADGDVERVKERTDIVALVGEHVRLRRAGGQFKGLCPFHQEKTPSFIVSPARQMFHCFGCGESGDAFSWLMKREGMTFPEALRVLAQRAGVQLTFERAEKHEERERLRATLDTASEFYHTVLMKTASGREARAYLTERGLMEDSIVRWRLGFVPTNPTPLIERARERGVTTEDLLRVGILASGSRGPYERFYGRVLFPLADVHGSVIGLAGRILHEDPTRPVAKYVNTPETPLYVKSRFLYGLDNARDAIRREQVAIVVEGYTDVIASHQAGVEHVVATSGTALTDDHLHLLRRFTDHVAFAFDSDAAGDEATRRAIDLALAAGFTVSVVLLPAGDDPADLAIRDPVRWRTTSAERRDAFLVLLERAQTRLAGIDVGQKRAAMQELLPILARIPDAVVRGAYIQRLAAVLGVDTRFVMEDLERVRRTAETPWRTRDVSVPDGERTDMAVRREEQFLTILLAAPGTIPLATTYLSPAALTGVQTRHLYEVIKEWYDRSRATGAPLDVTKIRETLPEDLRRLFDVLQLAIDVEREDGLLVTPEHDARVLVRDLLQSHLRQTLADFTRQLREASPEQRQVLLRDIATVTERLASADQLIASSS